MTQCVKKYNFLLQKKVQYIMGKKNKSKEHTKTSIIHFNKKILGYLGSGLLGAAGIAAFNYLVGYTKLPENFSQISEKITTMSENLTNVNDSIVDIDTSITVLSEKIKNHDDDIEWIMTYLSQNSALKINMANGVSIQTETKYNDIYLVQPVWSNSDVIAFDFVNNKAYTAEDLKSVPLLIPYMENNQEVYFLGQFNENNRWNGKCLINVYEQEKLVAIMDALYDDGNLIEYKQVQSESINGSEVWVVSDRKRDVSYNSGETQIYQRENTPSKKFTDNTVEMKDIYDTEDFLKTANTHLLSYYYGNTSNGKYNDETGRAFLIKYATDGTILTLYQGCFKNGMFHDSSYNAWEIARNPDIGTEKYLYYKGVFQNGKAKKDDRSIIEYEIPLSRIFEITQDANIKHEMNWYKY